MTNKTDKPLGSMTKKKKHLKLLKSGMKAECYYRAYGNKKDKRIL